jgi:hypothetical protein
MNLKETNSFLQPLVSELLEFLDGVPMSVHGRDGLQEVKCALLCVASDLPAARKICGFLGHSARAPDARKNFQVDLAILRTTLDLKGISGLQEATMTIVQWWI